MGRPHPKGEPAPTIAQVILAAVPGALIAGGGAALIAMGRLLTRVDDNLADLEDHDTCD